MTMLLFISIFVLAIAEARPRNQRFEPELFNRKRLVIHGRHWNGGVARGEPLDQSKTSTVVQDWFLQKVDHTDSNSNATYWQRYWYNPEWRKPNGPVFLMIGGESAETPWWVQGNSETQWLTMAQKQGALVFLLEHRFYGDSQPTRDMTTESLKLLSSRQAIEDVANFIRAMKAKWGLQNNKWITFGGSYPGALAAWSREKHPELIYGAVASSAPVQAVVDFIQYQQVVKRSLLRHSSRCVDSITAGFAEVARLIITDEGRAELTKTFSTCYKMDRDEETERQYFFLALIGMYMTVVQYSGDNVGMHHEQLTIAKVCAFHETDVAPLQQLANANAYYMSLNRETCLYNSYWGFIEFMKASSDDRAWVWQTCTEFGYFQSTDRVDLFGGNVVPIDYFVNDCAVIYGKQFTNASINTAVDQTNAFYGGRQGFTGSRVVFPNGDADPWHIPGILSSDDPTVVPVLISESAHCADMYADSPSDLPWMATARGIITETVEKWLR